MHVLSLHFIEGAIRSFICCDVCPFFCGSFSVHLARAVVHSPVQPLSSPEQSVFFLFMFMFIFSFFFCIKMFWNACTLCIVFCFFLIPEGLCFVVRDQCVYLGCVIPQGDYMLKLPQKHERTFFLFFLFKIKINLLLFFVFLQWRGGGTVIMELGREGGETLALFNRLCCVGVVCR